MFGRRRREREQMVQAYRRQQSMIMSVLIDAGLIKAQAQRCPMKGCLEPFDHLHREVLYGEPVHMLYMPWRD